MAFTAALLRQSAQGKSLAAAPLFTPLQYQYGLKHFMLSQPRRAVLRSQARYQTSSSKKDLSFIERFLGPKEMPERYTFAWFREMALVCTVFGIAGTSTMMIVRPAVKDILKIDGSFKDGPWTYRLCSLFLISPIYATVLVGVGTVFGRHAYFRNFSVKIFSRFGIHPELLDKNWKQNQKNFRKW